MIPVQLVYYEAYIDEKDAKDREKFLKSGRGREVIHKQLTRTFRGVGYPPIRRMVRTIGGISSTG